MRTMLRACLSLLLCCLLTAFGNRATAQTDAFITDWVTTDNQIILPVVAGVSGYNYKVEWTPAGGGLTSSQSSLGGSFTITGLTNNVTYRVAITGSFPRFAMNNSSTEKDKLRNIYQWGTQQWTSMQAAFRGCSKLTCTATDKPNLSTVTSLASMFDGCTIFNGDVSDWNVSNVSNMRAVFFEAKAFNRSLSSWNTAAVTDMGSMFYDATAFNQPLNSWTLKAGVDMSYMLDGCGMDCINYSSTLIGWAANAATPGGLTLGAYGKQYGTNAQGARALLTKAVNLGGRGWTITDGGSTNSVCYPADAFITEWTATGGSITIPTTGGGYNYNVTCTNVINPGVQDKALVGQTGDAMLTGLEAGSRYRVIITGVFPRIYMNDGTGKLKLTGIVQWGTQQWTSMEGAFYGCANLATYDSATVGKPDLSQATSLMRMFRGCAQFNGGIGNWDISQITTLQDMFMEARAFNRPIGGWNTAKVTNMQSAFYGAAAFNQSVGHWDVSKVTSMYYLFRDATAFNQSLGSWALAGGVNMYELLKGSAVDCQNYSSTLIGWAGNTATPGGLTLGAEGRQYGTNAQHARTVLISSKGWTINDGGSSGGVCEAAGGFITEWTATGGSITIPTTGGGYDYSVVCTNVTHPGVQEKVLAGQTGDAQLTGLEAGSTYRVVISGAFPRIYVNYGSEASKLTNIVQWGTQQWTSMENAFYGCVDLNSTATDTPRLSQVSSMRYMFHYAMSFNGDVSQWHTDNVTDMSYMFRLATSFNGDVSQWNTGNVTDMSYMFYRATVFNGNVSKWNVAKVSDMQSMFTAATSFNRSLSNWKLRTAGVNIYAMLDFSGMDCANYSSTLIGWAGNAATPGGLTLGAFGRQYGTNAAAARALLTKPVNQGGKGWAINGDAAGTSACNSSDAFVTDWVTTDGTITIPTTGSGYNYTVTWTNLTNAGVGNGLLGGQTGNANITGLQNNSTYQVAITGAFPRFYMGGNTTNAPKLRSIERWSTQVWTSMEGAFDGCSELSGYTADGVPNLSQVTSMAYMFRSCKKFNGDIRDWTTTAVTKMSEMFTNASAFNQPIGSWKTAAVTDMRHMFRSAYAFNQPLNSWNTGAVTDMSSMFQGASAFNQPIGSWNTAAVTNMGNMFRDATAFNQPIGSWKLNTGVNLLGMLQSSGMDCANYSTTLIGWATNSGTPNSIFLSAYGSQYGTNAAAAWTLLTKPVAQGGKGWTIYDGGSSGGVCNSSDAFITEWTATGGSITIPTTGSGYDYSVVCTNVTHPGVQEKVLAGQTGDAQLTGLETGSRYRVTISGSFPRIYVNDGPEKLRLTGIVQWGTQKWTSMEGAFFGCANLATYDSATVGSPDLSQATSLMRMFRGCTQFNGGIGNWDISHITTLQDMFMNTAAFNRPLNGWNTAGVINMTGMFSNATAFNQPLGSWTLAPGVDMWPLLDGSGMDCANYSATLFGWAQNPATSTGRFVGVAGRSYGPDAAVARNYLAATKSWTFDGDGAGSCRTPLHYRTSASAASFSAAAGWQVSMDSLHWFTAAGYPEAAALPLSVTVMAGHSATVSTSLTLDAPLSTQTGASVALGTSNLSLTGKLSHNGTLTATTGQLILSGTTNQTISGQGTVTNLTLSNAAGATIAAANGNELAITGTYAATTGTLTTNGHLRLVSNPSGTARHASGTITGDVIVERYLTAKTKGATDAYKSLFLASPVTAGISGAGWQQQIHITGPGTGGTACATGSDAFNSNGFDKTATNNPSMFTYSQLPVSGSRWTSIASTSQNLVPATGYRVVVRGPRTVGCALINGSQQTSVQAVTLSATGALAQGSVAVPALATGTGADLYQLVGNPYASPLSFTQLKTDAGSAIEGSYWSYSPTRASSTFSVYNGGTMTNQPLGGYSNPTILASGQAFFVKRTAGNTGQLSTFFREGQKTADVQAGMFRNGQTTGDNEWGWARLLRVGLYQGAVMADTTLSDETVLRFSQQNTAVSATQTGPLDATQFAAGTTSLSTAKAGQWLSIHTRPERTGGQSDTVALRVVAGAAGQYLLALSEQVSMAGMEVLLRDKFLGTQQPIVLSQPVAVNVTSDPASQGADRFELIFRPAATLAAKFVAVSGERGAGSDKATVRFTAQEDGNVKMFAVERSTDGSRFETVTSLRGSDRAGQFSYVAEDAGATASTLYYHIRANNGNGTVDYSSIIKLSNHQIIKLALSPNPAKDVVTLKAEGLSAKAAVRFTDASGRVVLSQPLTITGSGTQQLSVSSLAQGIYQVLVVSEAGETLSTQKLIKL